MQQALCSGDLNGCMAWFAGKQHKQLLGRTESGCRALGPCRGWVSSPVAAGAGLGSSAVGPAWLWALLWVLWAQPGCGPSCGCCRQTLLWVV